MIMGAVTGSISNLASAMFSNGRQERTMTIYGNGKISYTKDESIIVPSKGTAVTVTFSDSGYTIS